MANLHQLLKAMVEKGASDLHITTGSPPQLRVDGELVPLKTAPLTPVETKQLCYSIMTEEQKIHFEKNKELGTTVERSVTREEGERFESYAHAKEALFDYIEVFYNQRRRHSTLGQISPAEFERRNAQAA